MFCKLAAIYNHVLRRYKHICLVKLLTTEMKKWLCMPIAPSMFTAFMLLNEMRMILGDQAAILNHEATW